MTTMIDRRLRGLPLAAAVALTAALAGCSGGGSSSQQQAQGGGLFGLFAPKKDPNADLTPAEGQKLMAEIRKDPNRMQKLTPGERRYLARANAAANKKH